MLTLWNNVPYGAAPIAVTYLAPLAAAEEVAETHTINGERGLTFTYPKDGNIVIWTGLIVRVDDDQCYVITRIRRSEEAYVSVTCVHVFNFYAQKHHLPNVGSTNKGDFIGTPVYSEESGVVDVSSQIRGFTRFTNAELAPLGMEWIDTNIDFESMDKTTAWDAIQQIIQCAGMGELYTDNEKWAIVTRLGTQNNETFAPGKNITQYTIEEDVSEYIAELYPYGKDDLTLDDPVAPVGSIMALNKTSGYKDYSATTDPESLLAAAEWDMNGTLNPDALNIRSVNVTAKVIDAKIGIGDTITLCIDGEIIKTRVVSLTRHPLDGTPTEISCGKVKKDMYYYLRQVGFFMRQYQKVSTGAGAIQGGRLYGDLTLRDTKKINNAFVTSTAKITLDTNGNLYINGNKIVTE